MPRTTFILQSSRELDPIEIRDIMNEMVNRAAILTVIAVAPNAAPNDGFAGTSVYHAEGRGLTQQTDRFKVM